MQINFEYQPPPKKKKSHNMQRSLWEGLGLINKTSHRAIAKQCGPCVAGCLYQQIYSKFLKTDVPPGILWVVGTASHRWPGVVSPLLPRVGFQNTSFFTFFFFSKRGTEIMKVETLTCAKNWMDCLRIWDKPLIKGNKEWLCEELSLESGFLNCLNCFVYQKMLFLLLERFCPVVNIYRH